MASAPSDIGPVTGRIDLQGRLVLADPDLAALQVEAGSRVGAELALPQIAGVALLALKLGVPVSRPALAAGAGSDIDLWVRAIPDPEGVTLSLERWTRRPAALPRLGALVGQDVQVGLPGMPEEWSSDEELRLVSLSPGLAERLGTSVAEAVGQPLTRLVRFEENEDGELPLLAALASRQPFSGQRARPRRGEDVGLILSARIVPSPRGGFGGFEGEVEIEGEAAASNDALASIDEALDEALRTPLDRIIDAADRIVRQTDGPLRSDYAEYAGDIAVAARHLLSVIRAMGGNPEGLGDPVDLNQLAGEASAMLEASAEDRRIAIRIEGGAPILARGEPRGIVQILVNLMGNAVRHSPEGGTVTVEFERSGGRILVHVVDEGSGIEQEDQQRIFERFERAGQAEGGTGLGLAISRRLARSMDGDIRLQSTPGHGARFTLELPAA